MLNEDAAKEVTKIDACLTRTQPLRDQLENDYGLWRNEKYEIPQQEGKFESYTTNRSGAEGNRIMNTLAGGHLKLWIPLPEDAGKKDRKAISKTEQFANGAIALGNELLEAVPESGSVLDGLSFHSPICGGFGLRCYLWEEDDGTLVPDIAVWHLLNLFWLSGAKGINWAGCQRWTSPEDVEELYQETIQPDKNGRVKIYDVWDSEQFGVIDPRTKQWIGKGRQEHHCGHLPIKIFSVGSAPMVQSSKFEDTIKDAFQSIYVNNRAIYKVNSRLRSYRLTVAGKVAKSPKIVKWNSVLGGPASQPILPEDPDVKGNVIFIDEGKGQGIEEAFKETLSRDVDILGQEVKEDLGIGGMAPVASAELNQALPAAGIAMVIDTSLVNLLPCQNAIQKGFKWLAQELVSQYKHGDWTQKKVTLSGVDSKRNRFRAEISPDDIDDNAKFEAELIMTLPRAEMENIGMAVEAVKSGLVSKQTSRDKYHLVDDTDAEAQIISREKAEDIADLDLRKMLATLIDDENFEDAMIIDAVIKERQAARSPQGQGAPGQEASGPGQIPRPPVPQAAVGAVAKPAPAPSPASLIRRIGRKIGFGRGEG